MYKDLVIDDDRSGTELLITLLELEGFRAHRLEDWADPLASGRQRPDLVIMDILSAGMASSSGRDSSASGTSDSKHPVLMMSAEDLESRCLAAGANSFVEKPFD